MNIETCPECRYPSLNPVDGLHAPACSRINLETARRYSQLSQGRVERADIRFRHALGQAHLWEGKFHALKRENNQLRKQVRTLTAPKDPPS